MVRKSKESLIRISGQATKLKDLEDTVVVWRDPRPVLVKDVAEVKFPVAPIRTRARKLASS